MANEYGSSGGGANPGQLYPDDGRPSGGPALPDSKNKELLRWYVKEVIDGQNPARADAYFTENYVNHDPTPGEGTGREGIKALISSIYAAFNGFQTTIHEEIGEGDIVMSRWSQTFKQTGSYLGVPVTGVQVYIGGMTMLRVRDDRLVEGWEARAVLSLLQQIGAAPKLQLEGGDDVPATNISSKELVKTFFYEVWNSGGLERIDTLFDPNLSNHILLPGQKPGVAGVRQLIGRFRFAFPDGAVTIDVQIGEADRVVTRWTARGTHSQPFFGIPATNKRVEFSGITIHRVSNGRIVELWEYWDLATALIQIGAVSLGGVYPGGGAPSGQPTIPSGPPPGLPPSGGWTPPGPPPGLPPSGGWTPPGTPPSGGWTPPSGGSNGTHPEDIVRRWFDAVNAGDDTLIDQLVAPDLIDHSGLSGAHGSGSGGHKQLVRKLRQWIPNWRSTIRDVSVDGDLVTVTHVGQGSPPGPLAGLASPQQPIEFEVVSTLRVRNGKISEHWANSGPFGQKSPVDSARSDRSEALKTIARRWFDSINSGNTDAIEDTVHYDVVDHSGLSGVHGYGCDGHKKLIKKLRDVIPDWKSTIQDITVKGDRVTVRHTGRGSIAMPFGTANPSARTPFEMEIVSTVRISDGKIVEHWAEKGPFGPQAALPS
jgi:steroid delta-isomerase-like uncharacterized protein